MKRLLLAIGIVALLSADAPSLPAKNRNTNTSRSTDDAAKNAATAMAAAHNAAKGDPLLEALLTELDRSKAQLKMDQVQPPYFIEYRVIDVDGYSAEAAFGAMLNSGRSRVRLLRVVVRIGDYKQDSFFGQGMGETNILPLDDDPIALRHQIWLATDEAYKSAGEALTEKQAMMKQFSADPNPVDDFAKATPVVAVGPTVTLKVDENGWRKTLEEVTNLYRHYPDVQTLSAQAQFAAVNEYLVTSEGIVTRSGKTTYNVLMGCGAQAADGMRLGRSPAWMTAKEEELPSREKLIGEAKKMLDTLMALREAPIVEESYRGPVLFSPDATDDVLTALVGANVLGRKPQPGRPNRTTGAFGTSYKSRVLPNFLTLVDDPTLKEFGGKSLVGSYEVDGEGVKAQPVTVVENGILTNFLLSRSPIRDFPVSNGHGRSSPGSPPGPSLGVLMVKSSESESPEALKQRVVQMITEQGKPFGYRVETLGGPTVPRLLYRVYAKDGHEELVRGAVFNELDTRALRSGLMAVGNDPLVSNRMAGGVPTTIIAPSMLFDELEVRRADQSKDKLPDYPPPPMKQ